MYVKGSSFIMARNTHSLACFLPAYSKALWNSTENILCSVPVTACIMTRSKATQTASASKAFQTTSESKADETGHPGQNPPASTERESPKPFTDMPGPKGIPFLGNALEIAKDVQKWHLLHTRRMETYGDFWRENFGMMGYGMITCNPQGIKDLLECEGKYPHRVPGPTWLEYYDKTGKKPGLLLSQGEMWWAQRQTASKPLLRPKDVSKYVPVFVDVARDAMKILANEKEDVKDVTSKLFRWSLESGCTVLYNRRLGCLDEDPPQEALDFIDSVKLMGKSHNKIAFIPPWAAKLFYPKVRRTFMEAFDQVYAVAIKAVNERVEQKEEVREDTLVSQILAEGKISRKEMDSVLTDLMLASIDTTSNTIHAVLYEVASRPDVQEKIFQEISSVVRQGEELTYEKLGSLLYLNGVIKEATRLYPVLFGTGRILPPEGGIINGYLIPGNTMVVASFYALNRNESVFKNALEFIPERWVRSEMGDSSLHVDSYAFTAFGNGMRGCVGKRVAMTEMKVLLVQLFKRFKISTRTKEFNLVFRELLTNPDPIQLTLEERR